jgi:hypothetical protein
MDKNKERNEEMPKNGFRHLANFQRSYASRSKCNQQPFYFFGKGICIERLLPLNPSRA